MDQFWKHRSTKRTFMGDSSDEEDIIITEPKIKQDIIKKRKDTLEERKIALRYELEKIEQRLIKLRNTLEILNEV